MLEQPTSKSSALPEEDTAEDKAKKFYSSCLNISSEHEKRNMADLLSLVDDLGGWHLTGAFNKSVTFEQRVERMHNGLGLSVLFTWGVIELEGKNRLAIVAGGWNEALVVDEGDRQEYLKLMSMYTMLLSQAEEESVAIYTTDEANEPVRPSNVEVTYEYFDIEEKQPDDESSWPNWLFSNPFAWFSTDDNSQQPMHQVAYNEPRSDHSRNKLPVASAELPSFEENISALLAQRTVIEKALSDVVKLEESLANISNKSTDISRLSTVRISDMAIEYPFLNWTSFFAGAFHDMGADISPDTEVRIQGDFLRGVNDLVQAYLASEELRAVLDNYITWRLVQAFYPDRPQDEAQRRDMCLKETEDMFAPAVTSMYIRAKGEKKARLAVDQVTTMVESMQKSFAENLKLVKWMSPASVESASAKLERMTDLIGYPSFILNTTWLDTVFSNLSIHDDAYLMNIVCHGAFSRQMELLDYIFKPERGTWSDFSHMAHIIMVNAYYNQATNTMVVPIGMLQPPLFWSRPRSLTFGAFGIVVAHEITHAFDDVGIMYNSEGRFGSLFDNDTVAAFNEASDCIRKQYSRFSVAGVRVDGNMTLGENMADHGGLKIAEVAYADWLAKNAGVDATLPALEGFSPVQLFYLGYALPWCAVHTDSMMRNHVLKDEHAPDKFRVLGPLSNSEAFARAWGCPANGQSQMNPEEKCSVW